MKQNCIYNKNNTDKAKDKDKPNGKDADKSTIIILKLTRDIT